MMGEPVLMRQSAGQVAEALSLADYEILYGLPGVEYRGIFPQSGIITSRPATPDTMTRQRRRAAARAAAKG
jgi:hypothetical protein